MQSDKLKTEKMHPIKRVIMVIIALVVLGAPLGGLVFGIAGMEHYMRVCDNPLTVTATVTNHDSYDDDGTTRYRSYISYTVDGRKYADIHYESEDARSRLTAVGETVNVDVSPEKPQLLVSELRSRGTMVYVMIPFMAIPLARLWNTQVCGKRSRRNPGTPDRETISRDLNLTILSRTFPAFCFLVAAGYGLMRLRYGHYAGGFCLWASLGLAVVWLIYLCFAIRNWSAVKRGDFELRRDVLTKKDYIPGDDSPDSYYLYYTSGDKTWKTSVSQKKYEEAVIGATALAVYLPGRKKPVYHYDEAGDASS